VFEGVTRALMRRPCEDWKYTESPRAFVMA
jgi:hypothetical protein